MVIDGFMEENGLQATSSPLTPSPKREINKTNTEDPQEI